MENIYEIDYQNRAVKIKVIEHKDLQSKTK